MTAEVATETLPFEDLEEVFDLIARAIDEVGQDKDTMFLSKLALTMAHMLGDRDKVAQAVEIAKRDLDL